MKTKAISSFFVLFAIASVIATTTPDAFADHPEVTITTVDGSAFGQDCVAEGCYMPSIATVDVGGTVIFSNTDASLHTFTAGTVDGFTQNPTGEFDVITMEQGETGEWTPEEAGEIPYYCAFHVWMVGTIIVQEAEDAHDDTMKDAHDDTMKDDHDDTMKDAHDDTMKDDHDDTMKDAHDDTMKDDHDDTMKDAHDDTMKDDKDMHMPEGDATATGMLSDSTMVSIWTSTPTAGEMMEISIEFDDAKHVNHDIMVTQNGDEVLHDEGAHHHDGKGVHTTAALSSSDPVDITITFQGYGVDDPKTGPIGEEVVFSNVVPEFGTIAMMILAVAIISIVAVTAKSRVVPRF